MKKIFFKGYYGFSNFGDDIFVLTADYITKKHLNCQAIFIGEILPNGIRYSKKIYVKNRKIGRMYEMYYAFVCDYIIFFGGSTISRMNKKFGLSRIIRLFPFLWKKTSTIGTSISIPNEKKEKVYMLDFLNKLQFIAVRDNKTMESLKQCEIDSFFCFDPAIMIGELYPNLEIKNSNLNGILGLCPCVNRNMKKEVVLKKHLEFILSAITELNIESINVFLLNKKCMDDLFLCKKISAICLQQGVSVQYIEYEGNVEKICEKFKECNAIFGSRLHSGIVAYSLGIPFILEEYHEKCSDFLDTINHRYRFGNDNAKNISNLKKLWFNGFDDRLIPPKNLKKRFVLSIDKYAKIIRNNDNN